VEQERTLDANPVGDAADREGRLQAAVAQAHHDALEDLGALALAFDDVNVDADGVARAELRWGLFEVALFDSADEVDHR
jgi:hypothetical protein